MTPFESDSERGYRPHFATTYVQCQHLQTKETDEFGPYFVFELASLRLFRPERLVVVDEESNFRIARLEHIKAAMGHTPIVEQETAPAAELRSKSYSLPLMSLAIGETYRITVRGGFKELWAAGTAAS